jgi:PIN domain nuclease of toxin-antitoxin system
MPIKAVADTHVLIWYIANDPRLSPAATHFMDETEANGDLIGLSSISLVEIVYLIEKGRIDPTTLEKVLKLLDTPNGVLKEVPVNRGVTDALWSVARDQVPDMPDRIIAATAVHLGVPLITADRMILASTVSTIW